ncbi:MAG: hypothetical protein GC161_02750 [Planctomycetaceae bacterium]|nr:hypothetical protein [Planctomycetaceae bacterium]
MHHWLQSLSDRVGSLASEPSRPQMLVLLDADGTLLDPAPALLDHLHGADRREGRADFAELTAAGLAGAATANGARVGRPAPSALEQLPTADARERAVRVAGRLLDPALDPRARQGLLDLLRWLQLHPGVFVALRSRRSAARAHATLVELQRLDGGRGLRFPEDLLLLEQGDASPERALGGLAARGNLLIAAAERGDSALVPEGSRGAAGGTQWLDVAALAELGQNVPPDTGAVEINARGVTCRGSLAAFLSSTANAVEVALCADPRGELFLEGGPDSEAHLSLEECLGMLAQGAKGLVLRLGEAHSWLPRAFLALGRSGFEERAVQISAPAERWTEGRFRELVDERAGGARRRCDLAPFAAESLGDPLAFGHRLDALAALGLARFTVAPDGPARDAQLQALRARQLGADVGVPHALPAFLEGLSFTPASVTLPLPPVVAARRLEEPAAPFSRAWRAALRT